MNVMTKLLIARETRTRATLRCCDARCYNAIHEDCDCCCGGLNHGVGEDKARENCLTLTDMIQNYCNATFGAGTELVCKAPLFQLQLFN